MADQKYDFGRAARMYATRIYLGLDRDDMAAALNIRNLSSYQRWENGQAPIPKGVWDSVDKLIAAFDQQVQALVDKAAGGALNVRVWRGKHPDAPLPAAMWMRVVSEAMHRNRLIEPVFPEDDEER